MGSVKGKVHIVYDVQQISDKFRKRELVLDITDNPEWPEFHKFEAMQDKVSILDGLNVGQEVEVHYNLRGRPWTNKEGETKYFNSTNCWKIESASNSQPTGMADNQEAQDIPTDDDSEDDLPF